MAEKKKEEKKVQNDLNYFNINLADYSNYPSNFDTINFDDIIIDGNVKDNKTEEKTPSQTTEEAKTLESKTPETKQPAKVAPVEDDELALDSEVKKYEKELANTRAQLKQYLSKFSDEYLAKIRKTDYYKERLAYWQDYYSKRRQEAEEKDKVNNLARKEAMAKNQKEQKKEWSFGDVKYDYNKVTPFTLTPEDIKNTEKISHVDYAIDKIDKVIGKETKETYVKKDGAVKPTQKTKTAEVKPTEETKTAEVKPEQVKQPNKEVVSKEELSNKVGKYVNVILLDAMRDGLESERNDTRKILQKLTASEKKSASFMADKYNEKYNIYSDALASFDHVVTKGHGESKRAVTQRQKAAENFTVKPDLMSANDMLVDNLRTTYVDQLQEYITNRIVAQIEEQNLQNEVVINKTNVKDLVNQIVASSHDLFADIRGKIENAQAENLKIRQSEIDELKAKSTDKTLTVEDRKLAKEQLANKKLELDYAKFNYKTLNAKYDKLLNKKSFDLVVNQIMASETSKIINYNAKNKLDEYSITKEDAVVMAKKSIKALEYGKNSKLNFKVKPKVVEVIKEVAKEKQPEVKQPEVKQPQKPAVTKDQFVDSRIAILENMAEFTDKHYKFMADKDESISKIYKQEKQYILDEMLHWDGFVKGAKIKMDRLTAKGQPIPQDLIDRYNLSFEPYEFSNADKVLIIKDILTKSGVTDTSVYENNIKTMFNIVKYSDAIKNQEVKNAVENLSKSVEEVCANEFMIEKTNSWAEMVKEQQNNVEDAYLGQPMPNGKVDTDLLTETLKEIDVNQQYFNQEKLEIVEKLRQSVAVMQDNKEKLDKLEEVILNSKQDEEDLSK